MTPVDATKICSGAVSRSRAAVVTSMLDGGVAMLHHVSTLALPALTIEARAL